MPSDWTQTRIAEARAGLEVVDDAAAERFAELLTGKLIEKELRPKELSEIAKEILAQVLESKDSAAP